MGIRPWSKDIWFSPCYVINELAKTMQTGDKKKIEKNKEAWICAVALICRSKAEPAEWWIQIPPIDPPDVLAMNIIPRQDGKGNSLSQYQIEAFEIRDFDKESIEKSIERKLYQHDYTGMMVVGFVRRSTVFNHIYVSNCIKKLNPKAGAVFLIVGEENNTNFSFIGLFPDYFKYKADFGNFCKTINQKPFTTTRRSTKSPKIKEEMTTDDILTLIPENFTSKKRI